MLKNLIERLFSGRSSEAPTPNVRTYLATSIPDPDWAREEANTLEQSPAEAWLESFVDDDVSSDNEHEGSEI